MAPHKTTDADPTPKAKSSKKGGVHREPRSASPVKPGDPTPSRPKATPRRRKPKTNGVKAGNDDAKPGHKSHRANKETTPSIADSAADSDDVEEEAANAIAAIAAAAAPAATDAAVVAAVNGLNDDDEPLKEDTARVTVTSDVTGEGESETVRTSVRVEMPVDGHEPSSPENPEAALQQAKEILADAKELQSAEQQASSRKRKADDLEIENPEEELVVVANKSAEGDEPPAADGSPSPAAGATDEPPAKRTRVMVPAEEFRRQKMQKRALMGLSATIAVG